MIRDRLAERGHVPTVRLTGDAFAFLLNCLSQTPGQDGKYRATRVRMMRARPGEVIPLRHTCQVSKSYDPSCDKCRVTARDKQAGKRIDEQLRGERVTTTGKTLNKGRPALLFYTLHEAKHALPWRGKDGREVKPWNQLLRIEPNIRLLARLLGMSLEEDASPEARDDGSPDASPPAPRDTSPAAASDASADVVDDAPSAIAPTAIVTLSPSTSTNAYSSLRTDQALNTISFLGDASPAPTGERAASPPRASESPLPPIGGREPSEQSATPTQAQSREAARDAAPSEPEKTREADKGTRANGVPLLSPVLAAWLALGLPALGRGRSPVTLANRFRELQEHGLSPGDAVQALHDVVELASHPEELTYLRRKEADAHAGVAFAISFARLDVVLRRADEGRNLREARLLERERKREARERERDREREQQAAPMTADEWEATQHNLRALGLVEEDSETPAPTLSGAQWTREEMIAAVEKIERGDDRTGE